LVNALTVIESGSREQQTEWFAPERLELRRIQTDACRDLLANLIKYEAVHQIRTLPELLRRLQRDRRCFGLFHPALPLDPLVFTEVALTADVRESVQPILDPDSAVSNPAHARCAVFYSISNCQPALRGLGLGTALLLRAIGELRKELPHLRTFATLSPIPGFRPWLADEALRGNVGDVDLASAALDPHWPRDPGSTNYLKNKLLAACARYLVDARRGREAADPVARFHLGNGARLERLNWLGDVSEAGLRRSAGMTVNYSYSLADLPRNQEAYSQRGVIDVSTAVRQLAGATA
jgi:malonyl-CoA decarboxylase